MRRPGRRNARGAPDADRGGRRRPTGDRGGAELTVPKIARVAAAGDLRLEASGAWIADNADALQALIDEAAATPLAPLDVAGIERLDTFGAWALARLRGEPRAALTGVRATQAGLFEAIERLPHHVAPPPARRARFADALESLGRALVDIGANLVDFAAMFGRLALTFARALRHPKTFRLRSIVHHLDRVGVQAVPIMAMMTFLVGAIIAQQGFFHFRRFGAQDYVVDLVAVLILREIGVLLVTIMAAGRSGSAYTAEIGSMKMREEIDALSTMGFDAAEFLILPRVLALVIAVPALTFIGSLAALAGGGVVAWVYAGMSPPIYIERLSEAVSMESFEVGMIKAPFMALVVGIVAACEGLRVEGSTDSLGRRTTSSVVKSIFLAIVLDGAFAIFFAAVGM
ncbi:MAG: ABC transporter permease [Pseudomonadota bacterium]|nr:ABC transporter permease [Pseudomonadota bacterium]